MSNLHQNIPEDCQKYIKGLSCDFRTCPYIHSAAQREDTLSKQKKNRKPLTSSKAGKDSREKSRRGANLPRSSWTPSKRGKGTTVQESNDSKQYAPVKKTQETKQKPVVKLAPVAPVAPVKKDESKDLKRSERKPVKKVPKKTFTTILKFSEEAGTFVTVDDEPEKNEGNGKE